MPSQVPLRERDMSKRRMAWAGHVEKKGLRRLGVNQLRVNGSAAVTSAASWARPYWDAGCLSLGGQTPAAGNNSLCCHVLPSGRPASASATSHLQIFYWHLPTMGCSQPLKGYFTSGSRALAVCATDLDCFSAHRENRYVSLSTRAMSTEGAAEHPPRACGPTIWTKPVSM